MFNYNDTTKISPVTASERPAAIDATSVTDTADAATAPDPAAPERTVQAPAIGIDLDRPGDAGLLISAMDRPVGPDPAPIGKLGLSAQLRAAGRQGLLQDRQALLNSLHKGFGG